MFQIYTIPSILDVLYDPKIKSQFKDYNAAVNQLFWVYMKCFFGVLLMSMEWISESDTETGSWWCSGVGGSVTCYRYTVLWCLDGQSFDDTLAGISGPLW